jgi:hypothetical protein
VIGTSRSIVRKGHGKLRCGLIRRESTMSQVFAALAVAAVLMSGCTPRVSVEAPKEPITINMNIKIEHEIRVKVDRDLDEVFADKEDIF